MNNNLLKLFGSKNRVKILLIFFLNPHKEFYTRQLEKKLNIPVGNVRRELKKIEAAELIHSKPMGNLVLYKINQNNPYYSQFKNIILKTAGIQELLKPIFINDKNIICSFIYGSYAKNEFDAFSDLDVFIIIKKNSKFYEKINEKLQKFEQKIDREINADYLTKSEFLERKNKKDPYLVDILKNPKIFIKGGINELRFFSRQKTTSKFYTNQ